MVFESLVADLLNKYLGEYVDNLDRSQLKIGIWGGDVVLKDLSLKESALNELQLPVKTVKGFLGKLTLKIPWKNLYSSPVAACIEDLYLLVVPNTEIKYDAEKEEQWKQEAKQAQLKKVEEAKKKEMEKDKPKPDDTFAEKLATQIVRNSEISIKNIHIRYEDRVNNEEKPYALGITLHNLVVTTTNASWAPRMSQDVDPMIYKILNLEGLSIYWNSQPKLNFLNLKQHELLDAFKNNIAKNKSGNADFKYMLGPLDASAKLQMNPKPETTGFTIPKVHFQLELPILRIRISKSQYQDMIVLLESMDRMARAAPYLKYRPSVSSYKGNAKLWWKYMYTCILEEVRRRNRNWNWNHIESHLDLCKKYSKAYQQKLVTSKPSSEVLETCELCEKDLDVLNLVLLRQRIEVEVERKGLIEQQKKSSQGWFSGWWGGGSKTDDSAQNVLMKQLNEAMTPAEKEKLFKAIDYQEDAIPDQFPVEFVAMDLNFFMSSLEVEVMDGNTQVLLGKVSSVTARLQQRPAAKGLKVTVEMEKLGITGLQQESVKPALIDSRKLSSITHGSSRPLLHVSFEMNPLDGSCDQRVHVTSLPLQLIYDALTINKVVDVFTIEQKFDISQIQSAANMKIHEIKRKSALGLQYAIQKHPRLDLQVELMGFYAIVPYGGFYTGDKQARVDVYLGKIIFNSKARPEDELTISGMHKLGSSETEIMEEMMNQSYDKFVIELKDAQVKMILPGESPTDSPSLHLIDPNRSSKPVSAIEDQYLLKPISLMINLEKSLSTDDHRLPKFKISAVLPSISLKIAETRLLNLMALLLSIPLPVSKAEEEPGPEMNLYASQLSVSIMDLTRVGQMLKPAQFPVEDLVQFTELEAKFELNEVTLAIFRKTDVGDVPLGDFRVLSLKAEMTQMTYDLNVKLQLGSLSLCQDYEGEKVHTINTPKAEGIEDHLLVISFCKVDRNSPELHSKHGSVLQLLELQFARLNVLIHQEALLYAIQWGNKLLECVNDALSKRHTTASTEPEKKKQKRKSLTKALPRNAAYKLLDTIREEGNIRQVRHNPRKHVVNTTDLKVTANIREISLVLRNKLQSIGEMLINGGKSAIIMKRTYTQIDAKLSNFEFIDLRKDTKHPKVLSILGSEDALTSQVVMFNTFECHETDSINMSVKANIACFRVVFLNIFIMSLMDFLNNFTAAQAAILEASVAAAEAAKANMHQAYKEAFRVRLDIQLKAPIILVPANSRSCDAVLMDFGVLTMLNTFQDCHVQKDESELVAVIDNLHLELQNLKISRVKLDEKMDVSVECLLLEPISFQLSVKRNLSAVWYTVIPDLDISGRLESIQAKLTQEDYNKVMTVISQNLGEVPAPTVQPSSGVSKTTSIRSDTTTSALVETKTGTETGGKSLRQVVSGETSEKLKETVKTNIKFNFTLQSLVIDIFKGGEKEIIDSCPRRNEDGLARFTLYLLSLNGSMLSDGSLTTSLRLLDCLLDDTRFSQSGKINRYMERKNDEKDQKSMIDIVYHQQKDSSMNVDMQVYSFILILNLQHLMEIAEFFTAGAEVHQKQPQPQKLPKIASLGSASTVVHSNTASTSSVVRSNASTSTGVHSNTAIASTLSVHSNTASASKNAPIQPKQPENKKMSVSVVLKQPDIILVENMDDINTNAIIMNVEINLKLRMEESEQNIEGSMNDLQLFSCCFNPERRKESKAQILRKVTVKIKGSTPLGQGHRINIETTLIRLAVSPGTIELLNKIVAAITQGKVDTDVKLEEEKDYSNIWEIQKYDESDHWFLKPELAEEAAEVLNQEETKPNLDEYCKVTVPSMVITLEGGVGTKTLPMLLLDSSLHAVVQNWSSNLHVDSTISLQMSYYNHRLAVWEPLVEPVETKYYGSESFCRPWELNMQVQSNQVQSIETSDKSKMIITIASKETMEVTITKTCLDVLKNLGTAFNNAIFKPETKTKTATAPYVVQNDLGLPITVLLTDKIFKIYKPEEPNISEVVEVVLEPGAQVNLCLVEDERRSQVSEHKISLIKERFFKIQVPDMQCSLELPVTRADKRYFSLQHRGPGNEPWGLVSDVQVQDGATVIYLRSIIQVQNHFNIPVNVYFMTKKGDEVELVGTVEPNQYLNLPLEAIYTPTSELFFSTEGFTLSLTPFLWKDLQTFLNMTKVLQCNAKNIEDKEPFFFKVVGELEHVFHELSERHTMASTCYNIHLRPTVVIKNFLPMDIIVSTQGVLIEKHVPAGHRMQIPTAEPGSSTVVIRITGYLDKDWSCMHEITANPPELEVWTFNSYDSEVIMTLDLGMHCDSENESLQFSLYCPFWMINKTGLMLSYCKSSKARKEDSSTNNAEQSDDTSNILYHPPHYKGPIMFSFRAKDFWGKKKACIMVENSEWSDKFSLNVAGSSGYVNCKSEGLLYQIGVHIQLTYNSLTKQVTFTPYHVLVNRCKLPIEIQEVGRPKDPWVKVEPGEVSPFWPKSADNTPSELVVKLGDSPETTVPFLYNCTLKCLLKLNNKHGGVNVDIQITEGATYITFSDYKPGMAPALIINHSPFDIPLAEKHVQDNKLLLPAGHKVFFNWSSAKEQHSLTWCEKYSTALIKDEIGTFSVSQSVILFWVSFLDGMQRVLLFTEHEKIARDAELAGEMEVFDKEVLLCFHGLGLSLVDNWARQEVLYIGITSTGTIWEARKHGSSRFKSIPEHTRAQIEAAWILYTQQLSEGKHPNNKVSIDSNLIDFSTMEMQKPQQKELRRTYNQGLWVQVKTSPHRFQIHAKVNKLQMDNQNYDCVFPVIFAPVPPPKSVNMEKALKPFAEVSVVMRTNEHSTVLQYKYVKGLIQEFHVKIDIGFINNLAKMFEASATTDDQEADLFQEDLSVVDKSLISHVEQLLSQEQKNFYDYLHFSPLKIHVSFSLSGGGVQAQTQMPRVLNVLMQSLGVTLTDIHDVVLQLSYFERNYTFMNQNQLLSEVIMHYKGQLIKQLYVLVLGLDCLGNPFGLVVGIKDGVQDLFYEPFQGAIQGPGEFAEGLVLGVRSLLGHTVGGAAGAVSRITGAVGKGLAVLTFDEDYQRKRREVMNRPSSVQEDLAQSSKGLVMGVVEGVGGVFTKPFSGAKEEGVEGFFKGFGKGMVGLVTRPTAGVIDFASGSLNAVKRAAEMGEEVMRLRNPRCFKSDNLVRPYSKPESDGNKLVKDVEKGKYYGTDEYVYHTKIGHSKSRDILLLTDKRLMVVSPNDFFGGFQVEMAHTFGELIEPPNITPRGIEIKFNDGKKKLFRSSTNTKLIFIEDEDEKKFLLKRIITLMEKQKSGSGSIKRSTTDSSMTSS